MSKRGAAKRRGQDAPSSADDRPIAGDGTKPDEAGPLREPPGPVDGEGDYAGGLADSEPKPSKHPKREPIDGADDGSEGGPPPPPSTPLPKGARYVVAPGKCITSPRGPIDAGEAVRARDFRRGESDHAQAQEVLDNLVAKGYVLDTHAHK